MPWTHAHLWTDNMCFMLTCLYTLDLEWKNSRYWIILILQYISCSLCRKHQKWVFIPTRPKFRMNTCTLSRIRPIISSLLYQILDVTF